MVFLVFFHYSLWWWPCGFRRSLEKVYSGVAQMSLSFSWVGSPVLVHFGSSLAVRCYWLSYTSSLRGCLIFSDSWQDFYIGFFPSDVYHLSQTTSCFRSCLCWLIFILFVGETSSSVHCIDLTIVTVIPSISMLIAQWNGGCIAGYLRWLFPVHMNLCYDYIAQMVWSQFCAI